MTLKEYFGDWLKVIDGKELELILRQIKYLYQSRLCTPAYKDVFKVFHATPYSKLCQIWLFKDPYPQKGVANGIALGNHADTKALSPSLNIVKEAAINFEVPHNFINFDPTLESWCKQGILLLNSALTVEVGKVGSHSAMWRSFTSSLLRNISNCNPGMIYVLWGLDAKSFKNCINKNEKIIEINHPSWYARKHKKLSPEFFVYLNQLNKQEFDRELKFYNELEI